MKAPRFDSYSQAARPTLPVWVRYLCESWAQDSTAQLAGLQVPVAVKRPALAPNLSADDRSEEMEASVDQENRENQIDYIEYNTTDMAATKKFYSAVFGWRFTDYGPDYTSFEDGRLAGGFTATDAVGTGGPLVVIYATDLAAVEAKVKENGGSVVKATFNFPGGKRFHFADPSGNVLAVWSE